MRVNDALRNWQLSIVTMAILAGIAVIPILAQALCPGDCNRDQGVTVDEVLVLVTIGLGSGSASDCLEGDTSGDTRITVDEILAAVTAALSGCPAMCGNNLREEGEECDGSDDSACRGRCGSPGGAAACTCESRFPDVRGVYQLTGTTTLRRCMDRDFDGTYAVTLQADIRTQNEEVFSGVVSGQDDIFGGQFSGTLDGTVAEDGAVDATFHFNLFLGDLFDSTTEGSFEGTIVAGRLDGTYSGQDIAGDTCQISGSLTGTR